MKIYRNIKTILLALFVALGLAAPARSIPINFANPFPTAPMKGLAVGMASLAGNSNLVYGGFATVGIGEGFDLTALSLIPFSPFNLLLGKSLLQDEHWSLKTYAGLKLAPTGFPVSLSVQQNIGLRLVPDFLTLYGEAGIAGNHLMPPVLTANGSLEFKIVGGLFADIEVLSRWQGASHQLRIAPGIGFVQRPFLIGVSVAIPTNAPQTPTPGVNIGYFF